MYDYHVVFVCEDKMFRAVVSADTIAGAYCAVTRSLRWKCLVNSKRSPQIVACSRV